MKNIISNKYELLSYFKWLFFKGGVIKSAPFYTKKIKSKFLIHKNKINPQKFYPNSIKKIVSKIEKNESVYECKENKTIINYNEFEVPKNINLASKKISDIDEDIDWEQHFNDPEDEESLHRWNWFLYIASDNSFNKKQLIWILKTQKDWINRFQVEVDYPLDKLNKLLRWQSYTIGERLSNSIILYHCNNILPEQEIKLALLDQAKILSRQLEYFRELTGNHICNNARALYLTGVFFNNEIYCELAREILFLELPQLVTKDGFLREGSSHYQFIFTRWIVEISYFAKLYSDNKLIKFLDPFIISLLKQCYFFIVNLNNEKKMIPLIGDISPDFSPQWLINFLDPIEQGRNSNSMMSSNSWNRLWIRDSNPLENYKIHKKSFNINKDIKNYPESGWYRFKKGLFDIFIRAEKDGFSDNVGHFHNDAGHFCLFYNGMPIFVDTGRENYMTFHDVKPEAHNSILLNGLGVVPNNPNRYPKSYMNISQNLKFENKGTNLLVKFSSSGFSRIKNDLIWNRIWSFSDSSLIITDELTGKGKFDIRLFFHFDAELDVLEIKDGKWACSNKEISSYFKIDSFGKPNSNLHYGGDSPCGWQTLSYGYKEPSPTINISQNVNLPCKIVSTWTCD